MDNPRPSTPSRSQSSGDAPLLATHSIKQTASDPVNAVSPSQSRDAARDALFEGHAADKHDGAASSDRLDNQGPKDDTNIAPPIASGTSREAFAQLHPSGSNRQSETVAYTAAAAARERSLDKHGRFEAEFDPNARTSIGSSAQSPATLLKSLPEAASKTLETTITAPARTFDAIKSKLQTPSTTQKSKSEIPNAISEVERDMSGNRDAPGATAESADTSTPSSPPAAAQKKPTKSGSFTSFLRGRNNASNPTSTLMQRGPGKEELPRSSSLTARKSLRKKGPLQEASTNGGHSDVHEEQEEDEEVVRQRIRDQQKRLEDLEEAQTLGLLRTQQEAGIEPPPSLASPTKPSKLIGVPRFGHFNGSPSAADDDSDHAEGSSSRRSSFHLRRGRRMERDQSRATSKVDNDGHAADSEGLRRANSEKVKHGRTSSRGHSTPARSASASRAGRSRSRRRDDDQAHTPRRAGSGKFGPPRRSSTTWASKLRTKIPIKEFPLQGSGRESEFNQECPIWARQPYKYLYFTYFGLSVGFYYLPRWALSSTIPSHRGRRDWSWKKATMVKLYRHGTQLTFRTRTSLGRDLQKEVPHSKTVRCKFTWVEPVADDDVRGELRRAMLAQKVDPQRTCGFWYGDVPEHARHCKRRRNGSANQSGGGTPDGGTAAQEQSDPMQESMASLGGASQRTAQSDLCCGVGRPAEPGEKVLYHLHGGAYWIGTAHEKDVTAAVNTESLRYMAEIYKQREAEQKKTSDKDQANDASASPGSESQSGASASAYDGKLLRSFSLDYRLCVPGRPRSGSYPAALLDALSGYLYLVRDLGFDPENVIIAGDSAGGNLALALCRYLRDERGEVASMPGALLLMSPWVDISRSHSGPTRAPNLDSTVYTNQKSDIISSMLAFRNTAVSAFLGDLPARETYRNPYMSPVSLQLPLERGGSAPHYGFHGFPKRIYITSGSAEISYDQHLTLAHRLAAGTKKGRPVYAGDRLSAGCNAVEMAERRDRPRPKEMLDVEQDAITNTPLDELHGLHLEPPTSDDAAHKPLSPAAGGKERFAASPPPEPEGKEERVVIFDEVKDAVHDYLLFKWFEPERSNTWRRVAKWIDEA
ncbi:hypothetical protein L1887_48318 [Cichorium endivia]|nr:hypothetical protein L1887_48318 [Cichorium endivia]